MADKWNNSDRDLPARDTDERALGNEEVRGVGMDDEDADFEATDDLDDEEDEESGSTF